MQNPNRGKNPNCDGDHCRWVQGEVRKLPIGGDSNAILCRACYAAEMAWRLESNRELRHNRYETPAWEELEVYGGAS